MSVDAGKPPGHGGEPTSRSSPSRAPGPGRPTGGSCAWCRPPTARRVRTGCPRTASWTARSPGCSSTSGCCSSPSDPQLPLLERARYLAIFASNLDEFFMVRVAGLKRRIATGIAVRSASGLEPREVLEQITLVSQELMAMHATVFEEDVRPALVERGHRHRPLGPAGRGRAGRRCTACSASRCSRCSRRWPSTRPTRSPTSPASRSTSRSCWSTPRPATSTSPGSRCRRCCPASSG